MLAQDMRYIDDMKSSNSKRTVCLGGRTVCLGGADCLPGGGGLLLNLLINNQFYRRTARLSGQNGQNGQKENQMNNQKLLLLDEVIFYSCLAGILILIAISW
jgi:hypothetical protein